MNDNWDEIREAIVEDEYGNELVVYLDLNDEGVYRQTCEPTKATKEYLEGNGDAEELEALQDRCAGYAEYDDILPDAIETLKMNFPKIKSVTRYDDY